MTFLEILFCLSGSSGTETNLDEPPPKVQDDRSYSGAYSSFITPKDDLKLLVWFSLSFYFYSSPLLSF